MLPLWARVDLGAMAINRYSAFPKALVSLEDHHPIVSVISRTLVGGVLPPCRDESVYSVNSADWSDTRRFRMSERLLTKNLVWFNRSFYELSGNAIKDLIDN